MIIQDQDIKLDTGHVERGKMKLKKLIKKIIKEQSSQAVLHQYGRCPAGSGLSIINQGQYGTLSLGYKALLQGPQESPQPNNQGSFTLEQVLNNNNVIHSVWGSPSPGQVVKFQTCPPSNPNCESTCIKYNGTITLKNVLNKGESSLTTTDVLDNSTLLSMKVVTYPGASNLGLAVFTQFDIAPGTGQYAGFDPETVTRFANKAAGIVVGHIGTTAITISELKKYDN